MVNLAPLFLLQQLRTCVLTDGVSRWFHQARGTGGVVERLAKQSSYHQLNSAANLVPTNRDHPSVVQHDMVTGRVLIRLVHRALEHGAVHSPYAPLVAASGDDYPVPTFEAVVMAHARDTR